MKKLILLRTLFIFIAFYMTWLVFSTAQQSSLWAVSLEEPWFRTTLIDFYLNMIILITWVIYKERSIIARSVWILAFITTGAIATAVYVAVQFFKLKPGESFDKVVLAND